MSTIFWECRDHSDDGPIGSRSIVKHQHVSTGWGSLPRCGDDKTTTNPCGGLCVLSGFSHEVSFSFCNRKDCKIQKVENMDEENEKCPNSKCGGPLIKPKDKDAHDWAVDGIN
jgi:hypothetical protein